MVFPILNFENKMNLSLKSSLNTEREKEDYCELYCLVFLKDPNWKCILTPNCFGYNDKHNLWYLMVSWDVCTIKAKENKALIKGTPRRFRRLPSAPLISASGDLAGARREQSPKSSH
jgi:hypothetical protein